MLKNIKVINVGFGDSFILNGSKENKDYNVLVDCGTKNSYEQKVVNLVNSELRNTKSYGILSHFHEDHYKYLEYLNKQIDEFYLPNYLFPVTISILVKTYLLYSGNRKKTVYKTSKAMLRLDKIVACIKDSGKLTFVGTDKQKPTHIIDNYRVLWPCNVGMPDKEDIELDAKLSSFFEESQLKSIEGFVENFLNKFNRISGDEHVLVCDVDSMESEQFSSNLSELEANIVIKDNIIDFEIENGIIKNQHKFCLVFDKLFNDGFNVLFLGDIDVNILKNEIIPIVKNNKYKYLKIPHHGTAWYFTSNLPNADYYIISNGPYCTWNITDLYPNGYNSKFICTNCDRCNYKNKNNTVCNINSVCGLNNLYQDFNY